MKAYRTQRVYSTTVIKVTSPFGMVPMRFPEGCFGMQLVFFSKKKAREFDAITDLEEVEIENLE